MVKFTGPPKSKIRNKPISAELKNVLRTAAKVAGVDHIFISSGSQPGTHGKRTGSTRHDNGRAADLILFVNGKAQTFTNSKPSKVVREFITSAAAHGATGIGAATNYMGDRTIHVGFGRTPSDKTKLTWGKGGRSANAPSWLKKAAKDGWANPISVSSSPLINPTHIVIARGGLNLRKGPGLSFGVSDVLATGTELTVLAIEGTDEDWAKVDLDGDGLVDGHVFASFLDAFPSGIGDFEDVDEPT